MTGRLSRTGLASGEGVPLAASVATFTCLLACYYILRPVRDALAAGLGADSIKYLSSAVFFVMLAVAPAFGWLVVRVPRARLVPVLFGFFILNLVVFAVAFGAAPGAAAATWWARAFYVWLTVFNMFSVSVFWSRMADVWSETQGRRYFGIAAGGSCGGLLGPALARALAAHVATGGLVWISAALLTGALWWSGDYRDPRPSEGNEKDWKLVAGWFYYQPDQPFPLAAYLVPRGLKRGQRVLLEDVIEYVGVNCSGQGDTYRLLSCVGVWNGDEFVLDAPEPVEILG